MKISRDWLSDFLDWIETDPAVIADCITRGMGEVDEVEQKGVLMENVVVGKIVTLAKHPNADKLSVCTVETDKGIKKLVCGGTNLKEGMLVALAHVGATVKAGGKEMVTLTKAKIRGEESEGMICAAEELEIESLFPTTPEQGARPVTDLTSRGYKPGTPLKEALGLTDVVFHIDNHAITNRPDLFSHIGVARELVAMGLATWKKHTAKKCPAFLRKALPFGCKNTIPHLIPRYCACVIEYDNPGDTPEWMRKRLEAVGWRCISLPIDITNYVASEMGMPLHSFDADDIVGDIKIRTAKVGEKITTLDNVERPLNEGAVILEDNKGIFDLLGIMGGLRSCTKPTTRRAYLHSAIVDGTSIRKTVVATGLRTEAATVYEKGIPLMTAETGFFRALELFLELVPGARIASELETWGKVENPKVIKADLKKILGYIGAPIDTKKIKKILSDLGCDVKGSGNALTVTPPAWRRDITHIQDIAEEVARTYGYAKVAPVMPDASIMPPVRDHRINEIRDGLKGERVIELLHLAFTSLAVLKKVGMNATKPVSIENPIGEELSLMRPSLVPALLETAGRELAKSDTPALKVFEYGQVFSPGKERPELVLLTASKTKTTLKDDPLLVTKTDLTRAMEQVGYTLSFLQEKENLPSFAHAGRSATIICKGKTIGLLTEVAPHIRQAFDIAGRAAVAIIDLEALLALEPNVFIGRALPAFPAVEFDETLIIPKAAFTTITTKLLSINVLLRSVAVADLYEGEGGKTITLRFTYRADDRTLTQEEVEKIHAKVVGELQKS